MERRCPGATPVTRVELPGHRLAFVGYSGKWGGAIATIMPEKGSVVYGAIYKITDVHELTLDRCEGVASKSYRKDDQFQIDDQKVLVYISNSSDEGSPSLSYLDRIRKGYSDWGHPVELLDTIVTVE